MAQQPPTSINLPPSDAAVDTPDMPGTPTSATTSLSALSTTAINDGHRGHTYTLPKLPGQKGHAHHSSTTSLEAERADRISRLAGLSTVSSLRVPHPSSSAAANATATATTRDQIPATSTVNTTTQTAAPPAPAYFDSNGQPVAATRISTVGSASATASLAGQTGTADRDVDMLSNNEMDTEGSGYMGGTASGAGGSATGAVPPTEGGVDALDEDLLASRSVGDRFDDRMSDDGTASLVGFGEGANSTVSGPIYVRRPLPGGMLERSASGLSDVAMAGTGGTAPVGRRDKPGVGAGERYTSALPIYDREETPAGNAGSGGVGAGAEEEVFVDTTGMGPPQTGSVQPGQTSALRETQHR